MFMQEFDASSMPEGRSVCQATCRAIFDTVIIIRMYIVNVLTKLNKMEDYSMPNMMIVTKEASIAHLIIC